jgi:hypothetical protein
LILLAQQVITNGNQRKNFKKKAAPRNQPNRKDSSLHAISRIMAKVENSQTATLNPISGIFHRPAIGRNNSSDAVAGNAPIKLNDFEKTEMSRRYTTHSECMANFSPISRKRCIKATAASITKQSNLQHSSTSKFKQAGHLKTQNSKDTTYSHKKISKVSDRIIAMLKRPILSNNKIALNVNGSTYFDQDS